MNEPLLPFFGLKFHPFRPEIPTEALQMTPAVDVFCGRVERTVGDGGFVMVTGDPGSGKSERGMRQAPSTISSRHLRRLGCVGSIANGSDGYRYDSAG